MSAARLITFAVEPSAVSGWPPVVSARQWIRTESRRPVRLQTIQLETMKPHFLWVAPMLATVLQSFGSLPALTVMFLIIILWIKIVTLVYPETMQTQTGKLLKPVYMSLKHLQYTVLNTQQNMGINTYIRILTCINT